MTNKTEEKNKLPKCPVETLLMLLDNKWKYSIIRDLLLGPKRFTALKKATGASQKSLTTNLRQMEEQGLIERKVFAEVPPRVEYSLTDIGYSLAPVLDSMASWGTDYQKYCKIKETMQKNKNKP